MSSATDWQIKALSPEDLAYYEKQRSLGYAPCSASSLRNRCNEPLIYEASYTYQSSKVTGRRTISRQNLCAKHARVWAEKHGLELPPENKILEPTT
jgi:hypothetical protein